MAASTRLVKPYRRFALAVLGTAGGIVLLFAAVNTWVNPLWVTQTPWTDDAFAPYRQIYRQQRTAKAGLVRSKTWDVAFFGSSRIDLAFDPANPHWGDKRAVNLAVSAGTLPETAPIVRYALEHTPLETVIVGVDIGDLMGSHSAWRSTGFLESPFNPKGEKFERELRYVVGFSSLESSFKTIRNRIRGALPEYTQQGHRLRHQNPPDVAKVIARDSIAHALRSIRRRDNKLEPNEWKIGLLRQALTDAKEHGARMVVVIPPSHAAYLGVYHLEGDRDPAFSKDRAIMTRLVDEANAAHPDAPPAEIWDFNDFHPLNCEPIPTDGSRMHWWVDGTHARKSLGDVMLARIMGWPIDGPGADYGFNLTSENLDRRVSDIDAGYLRFKNDCPDLWRWMVEAVNAYKIKEHKATIPLGDEQME
jgi:hypothetical protein